MNALQVFALVVAAIVLLNLLLAALLLVLPRLRGGDDRGADPEPPTDLPPDIA